MSLVIEDGARFGDSVLVCIIMQFPGMSSRLSSDGNTVFDFVTFRSWRLNPSMVLVVLIRRRTASGYSRR